MASDIRTGFWIDHSRNPALGASITLPSTGANILIAATTVFVGFVASRSWNIIRYALHWHRATHDSSLHDGMRLQEQSILRNQGSLLSSSWEFAQLSGRWRGRADRALGRGMILTILALSLTLAFMMARLFSAYIASTNTNALLGANQCGFWVNIGGDLSDGNAIIERNVEGTSSARTYARTCYATGKTAAPCNVYAAVEIPVALSKTKECPFDDSACVPDKVTPLSMDTGWIDSHSHLGINAASEDRVAYRHLATCVPLTVHKWAQNINKTLFTVTDKYIEVSLGPLTNSGNDNVTFSYNTHTILDSLTYQLMSVQFLVNSPITNYWTPIPDFSRADADISLHLLAQNSISYQSPVSDGWFTATYHRGSGPPYLPDNAISVLGCIDQYQFMNQVTGSTTALTGHALLKEELPKLSLNENQLATASLITLADYGNTMFASVIGLGSNALLAQEKIFQFTNPTTLPNNQWEMEVTLWFRTALARLQNNIAEFSHKFTAIPKDFVLVDAEDLQLQSLCDKQLVHLPAGYTTFSFLGLMILLVVGTVVIILNFLLDTIFTCCGRRGKERHNQWVMNDKLHTLALRYEAFEPGTWEDMYEYIPVTRRGMRLPDLSRLERVAPKRESGGENVGQVKEQASAGKGEAFSSVKSTAIAMEEKTRGEEGQPSVEPGPREAVSRTHG